MNNLEKKPTLKSWQFIKVVHTRADSCLKLIEVTRQFGAFVADKTIGHFDASSLALSLHGDVYGRPGFPDGSNIITSAVISIDKILPEATGTRMDAFSLQDWQNIEPTYCATTFSGSRYYFVMAEAAPRNDSASRCLRHRTFAPLNRTTPPPSAGFGFC